MDTDYKYEVGQAVQKMVGGRMWYGTVMTRFISDYSTYSLPPHIRYIVRFMAGTVVEDVKETDIQFFMEDRTKEEREYLTTLSSYPNYSRVGWEQESPNFKDEGLSEDNEPFINSLLLEDHETGESFYYNFTNNTISETIEIPKGKY